MEINHPQISPADVRRSASEGLLVITAAPAAAQAFIGKALIMAGAINVAGVYDCEIETHDWSLLQAVVKPSAVTGAFAPSLDRMYFGGQAVRSTAAGANFAAGVAQTLDLTDLKGSQRARLRFTVPGGGSVTFAVGADPTNPGAIAQFNGQ